MDRLVLISADCHGGGNAVRLYGLDTEALSAVAARIGPSPADRTTTAA